MKSLFDIEEAEPQLVYDGSPPTRRYARDTEAAAAERIRSTAPTLRVKILQWVRDAGAHGVTAKEATTRYIAEKRSGPECDGTNRNSIAPRLSELFKAGFIDDSGLRRDRAIAWRATDKCGDGAECRKGDR